MRRANREFKITIIWKFQMPQETQAEKEGWPDWATERLNRQYMLMARISISDAPFSSSGDQRRLQFRPNNTTKTNAPKDIIRPATTPLPDIHLNRPKASRSVTEQKYASVSQKVCVLSLWNDLFDYRSHQVEVPRWTTIYLWKSYSRKNRDIITSQSLCRLYSEIGHRDRGQLDQPKMSGRIANRCPAKFCRITNFPDFWWDKNWISERG